MDLYARTAKSGMSISKEIHYRKCAGV